VCSRKAFEEREIKVGEMQVIGAPKRSVQSVGRLERQAASQTSALGIEALSGRFYVKRAKTS